jgi:hypothetical protein
MTPCRYCDAPNSYDTGVHVECRNPACEHYSKAWAAILPPPAGQAVVGELAVRGPQPNYREPAQQLAAVRSPERSPETKTRICSCGSSSGKSSGHHTACPLWHEGPGIEAIRSERIRAKRREGAAALRMIRTKTAFLATPRVLCSPGCHAQITVRAHHVMRIEEIHVVVDAMFEREVLLDEVRVGTNSIVGPNAQIPVASFMQEPFRKPLTMSEAIQPEHDLTFLVENKSLLSLYIQGVACGKTIE